MMMCMDDSLIEERLVTLDIMSDSQGTDSTLIASVVAAVLAQLKPNLPTISGELNCWSAYFEEA